MNDIFEAIRAERDYQITKWGVDADRKVTTPLNWVAYICHHATRWQMGGFAPYSRETLQAFRTQMVKVATLAVAAIQSIDEILAGENDRPDVLQVEADREGL